MRHWMMVFLLTLVAANVSFAEDATLRSLDTGDAARAWEAVGRLDIAGEGFCTGSLIAPDQVLTAAHCLFDKKTGDRIDLSRIEFRAGWRNGRASAYRRVRHAVFHPGYSYQGELNAGDVRNDLAILRLEHPIRDGRIIPFETARKPATGTLVGLVSYARDRAEAPSLQDVCEVITQRDDVLVTSCQVDFGSSGAPIFVLKDGQARIVSVVSAKAEMGGDGVSLGISLDGPLTLLQAALGAAGSEVAGSGVTIRRPGGRTDNGAKFVRP